MTFSENLGAPNVCEHYPNTHTEIEGLRGRERGRGDGEGRRGEGGWGEEKGEEREGGKGRGRGERQEGNPTLGPTGRASTSGVLLSGNDTLSP